MQYMSLIIVPELYATKFFIPCEIVPVLVDKEKEKKNCLSSGSTVEQHLYKPR